MQKHFRLYGLVCILIMITILSGCGNKNEQKAELLYYRENAEYDLSVFDKLNVQQVNEAILLLEVTDELYQNARFGVVGAESEENLTKIYYDTYRFKGKQNNYIYFHIIADKSIDMMGLQVCYSNDEFINDTDVKITKFDIDSTIKDISIYNIDTVKIDNNYFVYSGINQEGRNIVDNITSIDLWYEMIPLNCSTLDVRNLKFDVDSTETVKSVGFASESYIMNKNTGNSSALYSPLNAEYIVTVSFDNSDSTMKTLQDVIKSIKLSYKNENILGN